MILKSCKELTTPFAPIGKKTIAMVRLMAIATTRVVQTSNKEIATISIQQSTPIDGSGAPALSTSYNHRPVTSHGEAAVTTMPNEV